jgi:flagellar protein FliO/FliZ
MDLFEYFRFALALVFVLALIGVLAAVARRAGFGFPASSIKPSGARRLSIVEVTPLDGRRRLVLIRRDNVEHLLMLSPNSEHVIETGIAASTDFAEQLERAASKASMPAPGGDRS